jgi:hypothetical protein
MHAEPGVRRLQLQLRQMRVGHGLPDADAVQLPYEAGQLFREFMPRHQQLPRGRRLRAGRLLFAEPGRSGLQLHEPCVLRPFRGLVLARRLLVRRQLRARLLLSHDNGHLRRRQRLLAG